MDIYAIRVMENDLLAHQLPGHKKFLVDVMSSG